jgi:hypothetical protein
MAAQNVQYLRVSNSYSEPITPCLEPWADELRILRKVTYEIRAEGPAGDCLQVDYDELRITVYGWSGSILEVVHGEKLMLACSIPAPRTPAI